MQCFAENLTLNNCSNKKFSVDKILENRGLNPKSTEDLKEEEEMQTIRKQLKFGIDRILKEDQDFKHNREENYDVIPIPKLNSFISSSSPSQLEYFAPHIPAHYLLTGVTYEGQCHNKPIYSNDYYSYSNLAINGNLYAQQMLDRNAFITNNIGEGIYGPYPSAYNFNNHYSQSSVRNGEQSGSQSSKRKKSWNRAVFTNLQRKGLEKRFMLQKYITKPERRDLASHLSLSDSQVKVWFQNRRMKWRHSKEYREDLSKTHTNKEQQLISNFPTNKTQEND